MTMTGLAHRLQQKGVAYELIPHRHTERATDEAAAVGVDPDEIGKTIVVTGPDGHIRVVIPASERLDLRKARDHIGAGKELRLATEEELGEAYPSFELGAVPPFGGPAGDRVIVDGRVAGRESVIVEAGSHHESMRIRTADLLALTDAEVADVCAD
jgi:Ala-tRNA(Pro) deacylase